ncbi:hypothetical protein H696_04582 [Fonticula alba]|uniref:Uncharacterized protein n=1 Tax=Fonticula alba TaxID=691883 RepID=A0A058Z5E7_FONAL|nr:hypothetical protein H696_04582 [Fonticula alba]KCV69168.1 hypothetical protein H696_04582 [Fonticula alba]|eukprot:XP_009496739.1 hypothetical protein H696_04582 [Fonticula alba]
MAREKFKHSWESRVTAGPVPLDRITHSGSVGTPATLTPPSTLAPPACWASSSSTGARMRSSSGFGQPLGGGNSGTSATAMHSGGTPLVSLLQAGLPASLPTSLPGSTSWPGPGSLLSNQLLSSGGPGPAGELFPPPAMVADGHHQVTIAVAIIFNPAGRQVLLDQFFASLALVDHYLERDLLRVVTREVQVALDLGESLEAARSRSSSTSSTFSGCSVSAPLPVAGGPAGAGPFPGGGLSRAAAGSMSGWLPPGPAGASLGSSVSSLSSCSSFSASPPPGTMASFSQPWFHQGPLGILPPPSPSASPSVSPGGQLLFPALIPPSTSSMAAAAAAASSYHLPSSFPLKPGYMPSEWGPSPSQAPFPAGSQPGCLAAEPPPAPIPTITLSPPPTSSSLSESPFASASSSNSSSVCSSPSPFSSLPFPVVVGAAGAGAPAAGGLPTASLGSPSPSGMMPFPVAGTPPHLGGGGAGAGSGSAALLLAPFSFAGNELVASSVLAFQTQVVQLLAAPRLAQPVWLQSCAERSRLPGPANAPSPRPQFALVPRLADVLVADLIFLNYFFRDQNLPNLLSEILTAVLVYHRSWVSTIIPKATTSRLPAGAAATAGDSPRGSRRPGLSAASAQAACLYGSVAPHTVSELSASADPQVTAARATASVPIPASGLGDGSAASTPATPASSLSLGGDSAGPLADEDSTPAMEHGAPVAATPKSVSGLTQSRVVIVGGPARVTKALLNVLSYFLRCSPEVGIQVTPDGASESPPPANPTAASSKPACRFIVPLPCHAGGSRVATAPASSGPSPSSSSSSPFSSSAPASSSWSSSAAASSSSSSPSSTPARPRPARSSMPSLRPDRRPGGGMPSGHPLLGGLCPHGFTPDLVLQAIPFRSMPVLPFTPAEALAGAVPAGPSPTGGGPSGQLVGDSPTGALDRLVRDVRGALGRRLPTGAGGTARSAPVVRSSAVVIDLTSLGSWGAGWLVPSLRRPVRPGPPPPGPAGGVPASAAAAAAAAAAAVVHAAGAGASLVASSPGPGSPAVPAGAAATEAEPSMSTLTAPFPRGGAACSVDSTGRPIVFILESQLLPSLRATPTRRRLVTSSPSVAALLHTVELLHRTGLPSAVVSQHMEDSLQVLFLRSVLLAEYVASISVPAPMASPSGPGRQPTPVMDPSLEANGAPAMAQPATSSSVPGGGQSIAQHMPPSLTYRHVSQKLGLPLGDMPLLVAIASTHSDYYGRPLDACLMAPGSAPGPAGAADPPHLAAVAPALAQEDGTPLDRILSFSTRFLASEKLFDSMLGHPSLLTPFGVVAGAGASPSHRHGPHPAVVATM